MTGTSGSVHAKAAIPEEFEVSFQWSQNKNEQSRDRRVFLGHFEGHPVIMHHGCPPQYMPGENTPTLVRLHHSTERGTLFVLPKAFSGRRPSNDAAAAERSEPPRRPKQKAETTSEISETSPPKKSVEPHPQESERKAEMVPAQTSAVSVGPPASKSSEPPVPAVGPNLFVSPQAAAGPTEVVRFKVSGRITEGSVRGQPVRPHERDWGAPKMPAQGERWEVEIVSGPPRRWLWVRAVRGPITGKKKR